MSEPTDHRLTRRGVLAAGLGAAGALTLGAGSAQADTRSGAPHVPHVPSVPGALAFVAAAADAYPADNPGVRLAQSYTDELGLFSTAFVYDNALAILAWLAAGHRHLDRARALGDALRYAQEHDPGYSDGRLRQAYNVGPYVFYDGNPQPYGFVLPDGSANIGWQFGFLGTAVGDMAWPGIALLRLYTRTRARDYLTGALRIAQWIVDNAYSTQPLGGFTFGVDAANTRLTNMSTEHNIDLVAFFGMLAAATHDHRWAKHAAHARAFVARSWDADGGFFYTGSNDGSTINTSPVPEDVQTWSWLALRSRRFAAAPDWAATHLAVTDSAAVPNSTLPAGVSLSGVTFSTAGLTSDAAYNGTPVNRQGVWLEGTAHLAATLRDRGRWGDRAAAWKLLAQLRTAQDALGSGQHLGGAAVPSRAGVVAASSLLDTGFGFGYFPVQHVGATAWTVMATLGTNPFR